MVSVIDFISPSSSIFEGIFCSIILPILDNEDRSKFISSVTPFVITESSIWIKLSQLIFHVLESNGWAYVYETDKLLLKTKLLCSLFQSRCDSLEDELVFDFCKLLEKNKLKMRSVYNYSALKTVDAIESVLEDIRVITAISRWEQRISLSAISDGSDYDVY